MSTIFKTTLSHFQTATSSRTIKLVLVDPKALVEIAESIRLEFAAKIELKEGEERPSRCTNSASHLHLILVQGNGYGWYERGMKLNRFHVTRQKDVVGYPHLYLGTITYNRKEKLYMLTGILQDMEDEIVECFAHCGMKAKVTCEQ